MGERVQAWLNQHRLELGASAAGVTAAVLGIALAGSRGLAVAFGLFLAATVVLVGMRLAGPDFGAWCLGGTFLTAPPLVLLLVSDGVAAALGHPGDGAVYVGLAVIYLAGSVGGLVLELLPPQAFRVELPSAKLPAPDAGAGTNRAWAELQLQLPYGRRWDVGFLGRMFVGGIAAMVALAVTDAASATLRPATDVDATVVAIAVAVGALAVAGWKILSRSIGSREQFVLRQLDKIAEAMVAVQELPGPLPPLPHEGDGQSAAAETPHARLDLRLSRTKGRLSIDEDTIRDLIEAQSRDEILSALSWSPALAGTVDQALLSPSPELTQGLAALQGRLRAAMDAFSN